MINFENIKYRNFLSTGDQFTTINFTKHNTNLIVGKNGAGKSTFLDALTYVLFGKSFRGMNKPQLINSINDKDCSVEINFTINKNSYRIIRGMKPSIFEIYKNDKLMDQMASAIDQQKWFESSVLKMNYKSFTQIVILGSGNFIPFMQLTASHRREVIEDLLDLKVFTLMGTIAKSKLGKIKDELSILDLKKRSLEEKIKLKGDYIEEIQRQNKESYDNKKTKINNLISENNDLIKTNNLLETKIKELSGELILYKNAKSAIKKYQDYNSKLSQKVITINETTSFFEDHDTCPTCTQKIENEFKLKKIKELNIRESELTGGLNGILKKISEEEKKEKKFLTISTEITNLTHEISKNNTRISGNQIQITDIESEIQNITKNIETRNIEHKNLETLNQNLIDLIKTILKNRDLSNYYMYTSQLLKDNGVKTQITKKYIPLINQQVNKYLHMMDLYVNFTLNEEFDETMQSVIHEDFTYTSFSQGERQRIDLALLFSWREIAKIKNSVSTNLIIFDEVFDSSLDSSGIGDFIKIIKYIITDANIFIISHKNGLEDKFDNVITFEKHKGFSHMTERPAK